MHKIATVTPGNATTRVTLEGDSRTYKVWNDAEFANMLRPGAVGDAEFKNVKSRNPKYTDDTFIETWLPSKEQPQLPLEQAPPTAKGAGSTWQPRPEHETLSIMSQTAVNAAVAFASTEHFKGDLIVLADNLFDAMLRMCQRGKGKITADAAPVFVRKEAKGVPSEPDDPFTESGLRKPMEKEQLAIAAWVTLHSIVASELEQLKEIAATRFPGERFETVVLREAVVQGLTPEAWAEAMR